MGQPFIDYEAFGHFYDEYTVAIRFDTHRGTLKRNREGDKVMRYIFCNCEKYTHVAKKDKDGDTSMDKDLEATNNPIRRHVSNRSGYKARIILKAHKTGVGVGVYIHAFDE